LKTSDTLRNGTFLIYVKSPLDTFRCNFHLDGEVANLLWTCYRQMDRQTDRRTTGWCQ